jgi:hypothetical protein
MHTVLMPRISNGLYTLFSSCAFATLYERNATATQPTMINNDLLECE